jgi:hypothetical protein
MLIVRSEFYQEPHSKSSKPNSLMWLWCWFGARHITGFAKLCPGLSDSLETI